MNFESQMRMGVASGFLSPFRMVTTISNPAHRGLPDGRVIAVPVMLRAKEQLRWVLDIVSVTNGSVQELYSSSAGIGRAVWLQDCYVVLVTLVDQAGRGQLWEISYPWGEGDADDKLTLKITNMMQTSPRVE